MPNNSAPPNAPIGVLERSRRLEREERAGQARERAPEDDVEVALADDVDADRVRGLGVLADRSRA
ncbi:MAG: hypothetical protein AUG02_01455 [Chloroflexi bacterium 13_1_20CM_2_70_9]|nr:MAG: hypothetical protein AUG02_01455 [Chloroflexi bacterium 13_1_20CM_2_70_9]